MLPNKRPAHGIYRKNILILMGQSMEEHLELMRSFENILVVEKILTCAWAIPSEFILTGSGHW